MGAWTGRYRFTRLFKLAVIAVASAAPIGIGALAQDAAPSPGGCTKADFETVVDQSAGALRTKKNWTEDQFLKEAVPYVKDNAIDDFDRKTSELLNKIVSMGGEGSASATPDCGLYQLLRGHMSELVNTQNAKWLYMFQKIDAELGE